jgi:hypothetical protein
MTKKAILDSNFTEKEYKIQRFLRWFQKDGDELVGEKLISEFNYDELHKIFNINLENPMSDSYLLESSEQFNYFCEKLNLVINNDLYDYYLEVDVFEQ